MNIDLGNPLGLSLAMLPELLLCLAGLVALLVAAWRNRTAADVRLSAYMAIAGVVGAMAALGWLWMGHARPAHVAFMVGLDDFRFAASALILLATFVTLVFSMPYLERERLLWPEYYALVLFAAAGMLWLAGADDMMVLFLGLEVMSVSVYVLAGFNRRSAASAEAGLKYFLIGAFASAFLLYGIALVYGATGTTSLTAAGAALGRGPLPVMAVAGLGLFLIGFAFKVAAAPFHMWAPDVYDGSPTPVTGFMATGVKVAGFAALARVLAVTFGAHPGTWGPALAGIAIISMLVGNLIALNQRSLKRMLAYSSIAHAGYLLGALLPGNDAGAGATLTYLFAYAVTSLAAFGLLAILGRDGERSVTLDSIAGLGRRRPWLAAALAICMLSLLGFPGTFGFMGKWQILNALLGSGHNAVAVAIVLTSVLSAGYYLPVIMASYMRPVPDEPAELPSAPVLVTGMIAVAVVLLLVLGVWPTPAIDSALSSGTSLFQASLAGIRAGAP
ncbi:MAG TPA: NADH-quinone oxidoreductase subunit N [Gemmatimonadales bacterium]|nr:NADH-quinone oxidoreductase subunit N [Gemmatimonadales bacterium]